jgi:hypothetical protein
VGAKSHLAAIHAAVPSPNVRLGPRMWKRKLKHPLRIYAQNGSRPHLAKNAPFVRSVPRASHGGTTKRMTAQRQKA